MYKLQAYLVVIKFHHGGVGLAKGKNTGCWVQKFQNNFVKKIQASKKGPVGKELRRFKLCWGTDKLRCVIKNSKRLLSRIQDLHQILVLNGPYLCWLITKVCLYIISNRHEREWAKYHIFTKLSNHPNFKLIQMYKLFNLGQKTCILHNRGML